MKNIRKLCAAALLGLTGFAHANLVITEVMSDSSHPGGTNNEDWWELTNFGATNVNLAGYYWDDDGPSGNDGSLFPAYVLNAGASVIMLRDTSAAAATFQTVWGITTDVLSEDDFLGPDPFSGLSSTGDQIQLWDSDPNTGPATLIDEVTFGASTTGTSFEWDNNGNSLGLSVIGENGAFQALNDGGSPTPGPGLDIGSPGFAIPEPSAVALIGLSALLLHLLRRNRRS